MKPREMLCIQVQINITCGYFEYFFSFSFLLINSFRTKKQANKQTNIKQNFNSGQVK